jgi:hypothetical protein
MFISAAEKNGVTHTFALRLLVMAYIQQANGHGSHHLDGRRCPVAGMLQEVSESIIAEIKQGKLKL